MANNVIHIHPNRSVIGYGERSLSPREIKHITAIAEITRVGMNEIGNITTTASSEAIHSLSTIHRYEQATQASRSLSLAEKQALMQLKANLCAKIGQITRRANGQIVSLIDSLPPDIANTIWDDITDLFD